MDVVFVLFILLVSVSAVICFYSRKISNLRLRHEKAIDSLKEQQEIFDPLTENSRLNGRQKEYNEMIKDSADNLLELINDILEFSKLEAKKLKLENRPFNIVQTVKNPAGLILHHDISFVSPGDFEEVKSNFSDSAVKPDNFKKPLNLLLAEDDIINQKLMKAIFTNLNWHTQIANNGVEAVELYKTNKFDAIIMDGQMPEMNGFDAAKAIREIEKGSGGHIPIIALTAHAMKGDREKFIAAGMDDYMTKPVSNEKSIIEVLRRHINDK